MRQLPAIVWDALRLIWTAAPREFALVIALQAVAGLGLAIPILAGRHLLTQLTDGGAPTFPMLLQGIVLVAMLGAMNLARSIAAGREDILGELVNRHATREIFAVACTAELERFDEPAFHNHLDRAMTNAVTRPQQIAEGLGGLLQSLLASAGVAVALAAIEPVLLPLVLIAVVPLWMAGVRTGQLLFAMIVQLTPAERERGYLSYLLTRRDSATEVRAYGLAGYLRERWERRTSERILEARRTFRARLRIILLARLVSGASLGAVLGVLVGLTLAGWMTTADAGAATGAVLLLAVRLRVATEVTDALFEAAPFMADLRSFVELGASQPKRPAPAATGFHRLTVDNLTFTYPAGIRPALRDVSLEIRAGEVIALVGENGSGKTTLAKLLCQLYRPQRGAIRYDGVDVSVAEQEPLRSSIAVLFQDFQRYLLPVADNIGLGRHDRLGDREAIRRAALSGGADGFLTTLPDGYDTLLGPEFAGGVDLSGGQWQRVALARAFFRDAPFVILDEPTSALDARAEHELFQRVRGLFAGRTVLLISHRFSAVRSADRIYVLSNGRVVEHGTHSELMILGERYAEMFSLQAAHYVDV